MLLCQPAEYCLLGKITYEPELPLLTRQTFHPRVRIQSYQLDSNLASQTYLSNTCEIPFASIASIIGWAHPVVTNISG